MPAKAETTMKENEVDKFFEELGKPQGLEDAFQETEKQPEVPVTEDESEKDVDVPEKETTEPKKNRKHRRWEQQLLDRERELARKEAMIEARDVKPAVDVSEVPLEWTALYGDSPEARKAWEIQSKREQALIERAKQDAIKEFEERQKSAEREQKQFEDFVVTQLEDLEEDHNVDLTSNSPAAKKARKELLDMVQRLSPKNEQGVVTAYADFKEAYNIYAQTREKADTTRQKQLASRTMQPTSVPQGTTPPVKTPGFFGWRNDYGL